LTEVVNIRYQEYDVYIGRGSKWGNPFHIGIHGTREDVISMYHNYILQNKELLNDLEELRGKRLGCHCKPLKCHGDVLIRLLTKK